MKSMQNLSQLESYMKKFFEDQTAKEMVVLFSEPIVITEEEYRQLISGGRYIAGTENYGMINEIFEFHESQKQYVKMLLVYYKDTDKIYINRIDCWRETSFLNEDEEDNI